MFKELAIHDWRQFEDIEIKFHDQLTVITGANGSGKSTVLRILSKHFGWPSMLVSTPKLSKTTGNLVYSSDFRSKIAKSFGYNSYVPPNYEEIGHLLYNDDSVTKLYVPDQANTGQQYDVLIPQQMPVIGLHIHSHRPVYTYQTVTSIPTVPRSRDQSYQIYFSNTVNRINSPNYSAQSPSFQIKESLISMGAFGFGNEVVVRNDEAVRNYRDFEKILSIVLPSTLGFKKLEIRMPEVVLITSSGEFSLDGASGGIAAIIDIAWQIFNYPNSNRRFVVTIDEPENHLHPALQRRLLPNLIEAFPNAQFIVTTHSPFVVSARKDSSVYVLNYNSNNRVESMELDTINKAGTSNEILREVLGIDFTLPIWAEEKLQDIVDKYRQLEISSETVMSLRRELEDVGLTNFVPEAVAQAFGSR